ncbi:putative cAMP-dependent protein kinase regulatory subunit [Blattamonas nauphoetae]|uniref:cAMP-dependent protein kinase regulatory subunit n=1 Tax=Blattamonas nauphoetae TaxID=2049346 RepID=A0ABQ9YK93_9EUKA|nr:putative cAMP-dependent protein kinase regulatory subunit [Blattamonas nauphoetae]
MSFATKKKQAIEKLISILDLPKYERTPEQCAVLFDFLRRSTPVSNLTDDDVFRLCQYATHHTYNDGDLIFQQDDPASAFYIIISGTVVVTKRMEIGNIHLVSGDGFGQLGILKQQPRNGTASSLGVSELLSVDAEDYRQLFANQHELEIQDRVAFLHDIGVLRHLSEDEIRMMAEVCQERVYPPNKVVVREGDDGNEMFFIVSGSVTVVMTLIYKEIPRFVEITHLGPKDFFGELSLLEANPRATSVIAHVPLTCLVLSKMDFGRIIAGATLQALREYSKQYTPRAEIFRLFCEKQKWADYKKSLVVDILATKQKKRGI